MQIAIIRRKYNPFGGAEKFITRVIESLKTGKIQTTIITESWQPETNSPQADNSNVIEVQAPGFSRTQQFLSFQTSVNTLLKRHHFDLVQSHERLIGADIYRLGDGIHASWVKRQADTSPWYTRIWLKIDPYHRAVIRTEKAMAQDPELTYVANSQLVKRELMDWYQVPETRIELIENGIDTSEFKPASPQEKEKQKFALGLNQHQPTVLFVGSGFARKGAFELAEAIQKLAQFQLIIVGHDKHLTKLKKYIQAAKLGHRVLITGPQKNIKPYLAASDIFCLPSLYDSFPNAILEALCSGLPVVTTEAVGSADAIFENQAGAICKKQSASIQIALEYAWENYPTFSKNALALSKKYDIKIATKRWLNLYNRLITAKKVTHVENSTH